MIRLFKDIALALKSGEKIVSQRIAVEKQGYRKRITGVSQRIAVEKQGYRKRIASVSQRIAVKKQHIRRAHVLGLGYPAYIAAAGDGAGCAKRA
mgnify:CR=1 FL=1